MFFGSIPPVGILSGLVLKANELTAACRWQRALKDAAAADGSGWLKAAGQRGFGLGWLGLDLDLRCQFEE